MFILYITLYNVYLYICTYNIYHYVNSLVENYS